MIWRFAEFELDEARFELRRAGEPVAVAPKPLAVLLHLARRYPASVSHDELLRAIWPGVRVTKGSVARAVRAARRAFGQDESDAGMIRTVRGRGYAFSDSLLVAGWRVAANSPVVDGRSFIGRVAELAHIEAAFDGVEAGLGRPLFISGEAGIGKSRLLDELVSRAEMRGLITVVGNCREGEAAPPYWPWPEIVSGLAERCAAPALEEALLQLNRDFESSSVDHLPPDDGSRLRLFYDVTQGLRQAARRRPTVVVIEDLHWASPAPLHLLRYAGRSLARSPVLLVATLRRAGPPANLDLEAAVGELAALSHSMPELRLAGFSPEEIGEYCRSLTGQVPDSKVIAYLDATAGGNPLFLRELIPLLDRTDKVAEAAPASISHIVRCQFDRLSRPARELVEIAAVIGRTFTPRLVACAGGRRLERVLDRLEEGRRENLIDWAGLDRNAMRFRHDIVRSAIVDGMDPSRRVNLHRRVADALGR